MTDFTAKISQVIYFVICMFSKVQLAIFKCTTDLVSSEKPNDNDKIILITVVKGEFGDRHVKHSHAHVNAFP